MEDIRKFSLAVVDEFDNEISRFDLDYVESPKNLGFEMSFTTLESRLTTQFTSAREKKTAVTLNLNFIPPNAYQKSNDFKMFVQRNLNKRMILQYWDTTEVKNWEGKIQKFSQGELEDWGGLVCAVSFLPGTPKYIQKNTTINVAYSDEGKSYPYEYPYSYGETLSENNHIDNTYFDDIPLRITLYGEMENPSISLKDLNKGEVYSTIVFQGIHIAEGEHLIIDAIQSKILLYRGSKYVSAYDYVNKQAHLDSFPYARADTVSEILISLSPQETGYLRASYRQYII